jgi:RNA polymerase sporulation-specific sigma factor
MTDEELQYCQNQVLTMRDAVVEYKHFMKRYHKLVLDNKKLVYYVVKKLGIHKDIDNFYDIGMIGLCKAARSFDSESGTKFSTYAISCIRNEIYMYCRKKGNRQWFNILSLNVNATGCDVDVIELIPDNINIENVVIEKETYEELYNAISQLSDIEQFVIKHTFGLNGYSVLTQETILKMIYKKFGIKYHNQCSISRIKIRAIKQLKKLLKNL